jgi:hypothetical protein
MAKFTFSGPSNKGLTTVTANTESEARHLAMVERWGHPNGRPAKDTDASGRYLSAGLHLESVVY